MLLINILISISIESIIRIIKRLFISIIIIILKKFLIFNYYTFIRYVNYI